MDGHRKLVGHAGNEVGHHPGTMHVVIGKTRIPAPLPGKHLDIVKIPLKQLADDPFALATLMLNLAGPVHVVTQEPLDLDNRRRDRRRKPDHLALMTLDVGGRSGCKQLQVAA